MLELDAQSFMDTVMEVKRIQSVIDHVGDNEQRLKPIPLESRDFLLAHVESLAKSINHIHARASRISALRLLDNLKNNANYTYNDLRNAEADIESRLRDELSMIRMFVLNDQESIYLQSGPALMGDLVADRFPSILFEMEEAAKCLALARPTASAFHSMRALEVMIQALAAFLEIPDPTKPSERNWAFVLGAIKARIDDRYPKSSRTKDSEGTELEALYATLDAVKNPWRNATMHVENVYQTHEANHIIQCVNVFALNLAKICDEKGRSNATIKAEAATAALAAAAAAALGAPPI